MAEPITPVLVACAHGTRSATGRRLVGGLMAQVRAARPGLTVRAAFVDVQQPGLDRVLGRLEAPGVVVPLLLSAGFHVHVDVRRAVEASAGRARAAGALGPDAALVAVLAERLAEQWGGAGDRTAAPDHVVLAAAGSSDARAVADVERTAAALAEVIGVPVSTGYLSAASPTPAEAVTAARAAGAGTVAVASYLLAPGFFSARLAEAGADLVTDPLLPHPALADLVLRRYDEAAAG